MTEPAPLGIAQCARLIRRGELSPVKLTESLLARIDRLDPQLNAFILVTRDLAMAQAQRAQQELASGRDRGPMHGIPYALKDIVDVAGLPTTCHSKIRIDHVAARDAALVTRLAEAGAVLIGKTALHEFATGGPTLELPWPSARNPWNPDLHPGGSSSGSGTALAAGLAPAAIGTDTGGSIRNPATCCGLVGMKPTFDLVSTDGVFPLACSLDHVGPMTRTVEDNALLLDAMVAPSIVDASLRRRPKPEFLATLRAGVKGLRIGLVEHFYREDAAADPRQVAAIEAAAGVLRALGAQVETVRLPPLPEWVACGQTVQQAEQYSVHAEWLATRPQDYGSLGRTKLIAGASVSASDYVRATQVRRRLSAAFAALMENLDALITLSGLELPCRLDDPARIAQTYSRHARMPFNLTGTPALAVPTGFTEDGLPLGMQIAGRSYDEPMLYRIAWAYEDATDWTKRWPPMVLN